MGSDDLAAQQDTRPAESAKSSASRRQKQTKGVMDDLGCDIPLAALLHETMKEVRDKQLIFIRGIIDAFDQIRCQLRTSQTRHVNTSILLEVQKQVQALSFSSMDLSSIKPLPHALGQKHSSFPSSVSSALCDPGFSAFQRSVGNF